MSDIPTRPATAEPTARWRGVAGRGHPMVETRALGRDYPMGASVVHALGGVDLRIERGELVAIRGRSGSGKTTLLSLVGGLDRPTSGEVLVDGRSLGDRAKHRPHELSGGEQQRVAIARALANRPDVLLADEPTGQLDSATGRSVMTLLRTIVRSEGLTAVIATHDPALIDLADRVVELRDGRIVDGAA